jgi:hypothetical protein
MRLFQVGFEVIRLPQDRNPSIQTMVEKMDANTNANTNTNGKYTHKHSDYSFLNPKAWHRVS